MKHSIVLIGLLFAQTTLGVFAAPPVPQADDKAAPTKKMNVLFIAVDDLRPELGCYGKSYIKSPNIDGIAKKGMVFDHAYCQQSLCSPSRTSLMTGTRPDTCKVWDLDTSFRRALPDVVTLGQQFKAHGYFVQGMGKIYHGGRDDQKTWSVPSQIPVAPTYGLPENQTASNKKNDDGKNNEGTDPLSYSLPATEGAKKGETGNKKKVEEANSRGPVYEGADVPDNTFIDGKVADLAVRTLGELSQKSQPFFLAVGFIRPHLPWVAPKKYWDLYDPATLDLAPNPQLPKLAPRYALNPNDSEIRKYKGIPASGPVPPELARKFKQAYFASVSYTDAQIGRVLAELDRLHLRENTIIILWGDHGWQLGEHACWGKHTNVENDVNAPLIISVPKMAHPGTHCPALVEFVDIYPSLCELTGLPLPPHLEGSSFKPLLEDGSRPWKSAAFSQYPRKDNLMGYTMRTKRYRFTIWVDKRNHDKVDAIELYDHKTDPQENSNIAGLPDQAQVVSRLMEQWKKGWQGAKPPPVEATADTSKLTPKN